MNGRQEPFHIRHLQILSAGVLLSCFALVVGFYEHHTLGRAEWETHQYSRFLRMPLWNLDESAGAEVIELIFRSNEYRAIEVVQPDGAVFAAEIGEHGLDAFDRALAAVGMIGDRSVVVPIVHDGRVLGRLKATWINRNVYLYAYVLVFLALLWKLAHYHFSSRYELAARVEERTEELQASNVQLAREVDERIRTEEALAQSNERHEATIKQSVDSIFLVDVETREVVEANPAFQRLLGYGPEEIRGLTLYDFVDLERAKIDANLQFMVEHGEAITEERRYRDRDGELVDVEMGGNVIAYGGRQVLCIVARDIVARKRMERENIRQERLGALGEMASGIAHDFNNRLSMILGYSDLLLSNPERLQDIGYLTESLETIRTSSEDAAEVVRRLRAFHRYREEDEVFQPVDLSALAAEAAQLTQPKWQAQAQASGRTIRLETDLPEVPGVNGNESELREVLTNLIFNAVDAMPEGGALSLSTEVQGDSVLLRVRDEGVGMDEETQQRCMEPFFTTKGEDGSGLGLGLVFGIIGRHEGQIELESAPGIGTTFTVRLPQVAPATHADGEGLAGGALPPQRILVVDDEDQVLQVVRGYLQIEGHEVVTASDGVDGLERFEETPFDVVISDRAMPIMNGDQLAAAVKERDPDMPFVMLTGFGDLMQAQGEHPEGVDVLLGKPVTIGPLRQALREALGLESGGE